MELKTLSPREQQVYDYIKGCHDLGAQAPSQVEIAIEMGFSTSRAAQHLNKIEDKGHIRRGRGRGIIFIDGAG